MPLGRATVPHTAEPKPVLLVNHSTDTVEMYRIGLAMAGFRAVLASHALSARRALDHDHPVGAVADLEASDACDGWELVETIRNDPAAPEVPVVLLSGRVDPVIQRHADGTGCAVLVGVER